MTQNWRLEGRSKGPRDVGGMAVGQWFHQSQRRLSARRLPARGERGNVTLAPRPLGWVNSVCPLTVAIFYHCHHYQEDVGRAHLHDGYMYHSPHRLPGPSHIHLHLPPHRRPPGPPDERFISHGPPDSLMPTFGPTHPPHRYVISLRPCLCSLGGTEKTGTC